MQLALSLMASLVDQMNAKEMGKTELIASFVSSIVYILSQKLVMLCHCSDTFNLPDLAIVL